MPPYMVFDKNYNVLGRKHCSFEQNLVTQENKVILAPNC